MEALVKEIRACRICEKHLPLCARPIIAAHAKTKIALISQAPGRVAHLSNTAWDDQGGNRLREWLGVSEDVFYHTENFAFVPMSFCYPGRGKGGDLPPRPECAPIWHQRVLESFENLQLKILIGSHAQMYYLKSDRKRTLKSSVEHFQEYLPHYLPLPHPSPRNNIWLRKNMWFENEVIPQVQQMVHGILNVKK